MSSSRPPAYILVPLLALVLTVSGTVGVVLMRDGSEALVGTPASERAADPSTASMSMPAVTPSPPGRASPARETREAPAFSSVLLSMQRRSWGVTIPRVPGELDRLDEIEDLTGAVPDRVMWYAAWSEFPDFPARLARRVARRDALPEISWEPWNPAKGLDQPRFSMAAIADGERDAYLTRWARQARRYGGPVVMRFAHAMNGDWYPWGAATDGTTAAEHRAAWRHVVEVFRDEGADNVLWSWSPNVPYPGSAPIAGLYPGDAYVDRVALDGYNWAGYRPGTAWTSFRDVFEDGFDQLAAVSDRPAYVGEVGCPQRGGSKARWVRHMFDTLAERRSIRGITWFDFEKDADWRIDSSSASTAAFREGLRRYGARLSPTAGS